MRTSCAGSGASAENNGKVENNRGYDDREDCGEEDNGKEYIVNGNRKDNPLLTGKIETQLVRLALPLLLGNILQQCYHIADALIIGRFLGMDAFAAVSVAGTVMNLLVFALNGFCTGVSILFSALFGRGNKQKFREEMFVAVVFGSLLTGIISVASMAGMERLLLLIHTPAHLYGYASEYLNVIIGGMIVTYCYNLLSGILRSVGDTGASLKFLTVAVTGNVALDILFVAVLGWGVRGAACATVFSQAASAAGCFWYLKRAYGELLCTRRDAGLHWELFKNTVRYGLASAFQESSLYIGKILVQGAVNLLGTPGIAGFAAASRLEGFANSFCDSGALATSVMISQNCGAGKRQRVTEGVKKSLLMHGALGIAIPLILFTQAGPGVKLFLGVGNGGALEQGAGYLRTVSVFYILCFVGSSLVGFFRGIGKVHIPVIGTTLNISVRVVLAYGFTKHWGLAGLGAATGIGWMMVVGYQIVSLLRISRDDRLRR